VQRRRKLEVVADLRAQLAVIAPTVGDRIPSERALAARMGCSRETLRAALDVLEAENMLWRHVGQGTFRGRRPETALLRDSLIIEGSTVADIMRARLLMEPVIAAEAARLATPDDIRHLRDCVQQCRQGRDSFACEQADSRFHAAVAQVAHNTVLSALLGYLSDFRRRSVWQREWDRSYRKVGVAEFTHDHSDQHAAIVDAIAEADENDARTAMQKHLKTIAVVLAAGS
jgi:DNA-binding FadR family transcriptional regulator